jgi:hypothetical protein
MGLSFENNTYNILIKKVVPEGNTLKNKLVRILLPVLICWLPLAILTLYDGTFWTGNLKDSFITNFDSQVRFLVCLPILILSEEIIGKRLSLILAQFTTSGIIKERDFHIFEEVNTRGARFLQSKWTTLVLVLICYIQVFAVISYESEYTSLLTWQVDVSGAEARLNFAGWWNVLISRPTVFFLLLQWVLRIFIWGWILRKISKLDLVLYPIHPDLVGGIGFVGYALRFFSPIAFAISAIITGNMIDFILIEGMDLKSFALPALIYFLFINLLFTLPLFSFTGKLIEARERSIFENYDFANGMYRELRTTLKKGFKSVDQQDLKREEFSSVCDLSDIIDNSLNMKYIPFTLRDLFPVWAMTILPFIVVILLEIPVNELLKVILSFLV